MSVIITCNVGSSNIKLSKFDTETHKCERFKVHNIKEVIKWLHSIDKSNIVAIGHRMIHGGPEFMHPIKIDDIILEKLRRYVPLAPLHQLSAIMLIKEIQKFYSDIKQIVCFDTAFHHTIPEIERLLPLPYWYYKQGIQRYGSHGLSYQYIANVLPKFSRIYEKTIAVHLGSSASACAMKNLRSIAITMGFSTLDGLMMSTCSGALDSGVVIYLEKELEMKPQEIDRLLYLESGLQGVSGISGDMKILLASDKPEAKRAVELYCYLAAKQIVSLLPALGGIDSIVFTGGIGENAAPIRERISTLLGWVSNFLIYVIPADEESVIASSCYAFLA
ncbi:MAG: acetate kinase [Alphaproteobacteria bacterium]|nr:acetate kinase [Alphaproteobacteria bacterium]